MPQPTPPNSLTCFRNFHAPQAKVIQEAVGDIVPTYDAQWLHDQSCYGLLPRYQRPATTLYDRSDGRYLPIYQTEFDLAVIRAMGRLLAETAPGLVGGLRNMCNYTIGEGYAFTATKEATASASDEQVAPLITAIQREIDILLDDVEFISGLDREIHNVSVTDGEAILHIKPTPSGRVRIYRREPDELRMPLGTRELEDWVEATYGIPCSEFVTSWSFGILTRLDQPDEHLAYHFVSDERGLDWDVIPADRVVHIKRNVPRNAKRGFSDFYPIESDSTRGEKLRRNMAEGAAVQSAIAFVRQHVQGTTKAGVEQMLGDNKVGTSQQPLAHGGSRSRNVVSYRPGTVVDISAGLEYKPGPLGSDRANDFMVVAEYVQRMQAVRWSMPEYMFSGDASNANYSSTMEATAPFVKSCEAEQRFYARHFVATIWKALKIRYELGAFSQFGLSWDELEGLIKIKAECPEVATRDELAMVQRQQILVTLGVLSRKTMAAQNGLDYAAELANGAAPALPTGPAPQPGSPGTPGGTPTPDALPATPAGGELLDLNLPQIYKINKLRQQYLDAYRAGQMDEITLRHNLDGLGIPAAKIDAYLDGDPANDPAPVLEALDGVVVPAPTPEPQLPARLPSREELAAQTAAKMRNLIDDLAEAVIQDDKPAQKRITKAMDELKASSAIAAGILGHLGVFDPGIHGEPPHGSTGQAAVIAPPDNPEHSGETDGHNQR